MQKVVVIINNVFTLLIGYNNNAQQPLKRRKSIRIPFDGTVNRTVLFLVFFYLSII